MPYFGFAMRFILGFLGGVIGCLISEFSFLLAMVFVFLWFGFVVSKQAKKR